MKRLFLCMAAIACAALAQQGPGGQDQPGQRPQGQRGRGGPPPANSRSNEQAGVNIDRFIGYAGNSPVHLSHATLLTHNILKAGDPYSPGATGAVLEYRKDLSTATLLGHNVTPIVTLADEFFFYVQNGEGRLDDGKQAWDLREGAAILVPPNAPHRFTNTSDKPLNMIMLTWTAAGTPKSEIIVRDVNLLPYCEENAHWNNTSKCIFGVNDGLMQGERIYAVMLQPWAASQPHSHGPGTEEIWTKLSPGTAVMLIGSELREYPENAAYLVPPTGFTEHSNLNLSKDRVDWWLYVARGRGQAGNLVTGAGTPGGIAANATPSPEAPPAVTAPGGGGRGGFARNPNIIRDQASTEAANVRSKPLK
jgi:mannose-6-phosphate isomerase-like protein (cupin superfamily)